MMRKKIITTILFSASIIGILYFNIDKKNFIHILALCILASISFFINLMRSSGLSQKSKKKKEEYISTINYRQTRSK